MRFGFSLLTLRLELRCFVGGLERRCWLLDLGLLHGIEVWIYGRGLEVWSEGLGLRFGFGADVWI